MKKRVFVSGGNGLIGGNLVEHLCLKGHEVVSCDNFIGSYKENVFKHQNHIFYKCDINDISKMKEITRGCDIIFHTAALAHEGGSNFFPNSVSNSIIGGTTSLAVASAENKIPKFVNFSSMARYGDNPIPYKENMTPKPVDVYGISKVSAEKMLDNLGLLHGFKVVHLVPFNNFGSKYGKYDDPFRSVIHIWINLILQNKTPVIYGDGEQKRRISFTRDTTPIISNFIEHDFPHGEIFNLYPGTEPISMNKLFNIICKTLDKNISPTYMEERPNEIKEAYPSFEKISKIFGEKKAVSLEDGINEIASYIKQQGTKPFEYHIPIEIKTEKTPKPWLNKLF